MGYRKHMRGPIQVVASLAREVSAGRAKGTLPHSLPRRLRELVTEPIVNRYAPPSLGQLVGDGSTVSYDAATLLEQLIPGPPAYDHLKEEHTEVFAELMARRQIQVSEPLYRSQLSVERETSLFLYALTRRSKPLHILETGVANGNSSFVFLTALARNGTGTLHSVDVGDQVGALVTSTERADWDLHVLHAVRLREAFLAHIRRLPPLDLFMHDSDHTAKWQRMEYEAALCRLVPGGYLASDDVDSSRAFVAFCRAHDLRSHFMIDRFKVFGITHIAS